MSIYPIASLFSLFSFILFLTFVSERRDYQDERLNLPYRFSIKLKFPKGVIRAIRGQPNRLSRNYRRRHGGNLIGYVLISFHNRDALCTLSRQFLFGRAYVCFVLVGVFFPIYSFLRSLIKQSLSATVSILA